MKIGILTYHCVTNFGAQLQTLSTIGYMKKHGHEPVVLNWFPLDLEEFYLAQHPREQFDEQFHFAMKEMPVSRLCRTIDELSEEIDRLNLDALFLGSDALFDYFPIKQLTQFSFRQLKKIIKPTTSNHKLPNPFWGGFNDRITKKIPYSGFSISSQNMRYHDLNKEEKKELCRLLNNFSLITVRDEWTKKMIEAVAGRKDVFVTPDPVFAFNENTNYKLSKEEIINKYKLPSNYILVSFCQDKISDDFVNEVISKIEKTTGAECVSFPMPRKLKEYNTKKSIKLPLPTLDWYYLIKYSSGYIGELMHPIIVCLHNSVPFYCFDQYGTYRIIIPRVWRHFIPESSKIYDILERAGLLRNMISYSKLNDITPDLVAKQFLSFDKTKCEKFSVSQYKRYCDGMVKVLNSLIIKQG